MERNVVFPDKVIGLYRRLSLAGYPPGLPCFGRAASLGPFDRGGEVANHGIKPHVDTFIFVTVNRNGNAPIQVASDRSWSKSFFEPVHGKPQRVGTPEIFILG